MAAASCSTRGCSPASATWPSTSPWSPSAGPATSSSASCSPMAAGWWPSASCPAQLDRPAHEGRGARGPSVHVGRARPDAAAVDHTVVAAERDGDAWWVVMQDVSDSLLPHGDRLSTGGAPAHPRGGERDVGGVLGRAGSPPLLAARLLLPLLAGDRRQGARRPRSPAEAVRGLLGGVRRGRRHGRRGGGPGHPRGSGAVCCRAGRLRDDTHPRRHPRRADRDRRPPPDPARLGPRHPGPSGRRLLLVHLP